MGFSERRRNLENNFSRLSTREAFLKKEEGSMSVKTLLVLLFLIITMPLSIGAQAPSLTESPPAVKVEEVRQFIDEYKGRFVKMEVDAFMALFSRDATENRMLPYADIQEAYRRTIAHSKSIIYNLKIYSIKKGGRERAFQGDIQWEIFRENGSLKIREINYGRDRLR